jgi:hypothetical protein
MQRIQRAEGVRLLRDRAGKWLKELGQANSQLWKVVFALSIENFCQKNAREKW